MFSKRHYEALALVMQNTCPARASGNIQWAIHIRWRIVREELADMLARDNGLFKRDRFIAACEPGANVRAKFSNPMPKDI